MLEEQKSRQSETGRVIIDSLVPEDHLLRKVKKHIGLRSINDMCRDCPAGFGPATIIFSDCFACALM